LRSSRRMKIFTIGFTKKTAEVFFEKLKASDAARLIDVRLNNVSQLAGFAKRDDLRYFIRTICDMEYQHLPVLAPTQAILDGYRKQKAGWANYERQFNELMRERRIEKQLSRDLIDRACLLCSEERPDQCHRRLVAEYLSAKWGGVEIAHIL
jgi:uncharacterized protein (DUF488 family)